MNYRSLASRATILIVGVLALVLGNVVPGSFIPIAQAAGTITGNVFRDFNANGVKDASETVGVPSVTVTAYDGAGAAQGTATTDTAGNYTLAATGTGPYRIEFTTLPSGYYPGPQGTGSGSTVQFVPDGNSSNVNLGINALGSYGPTAPELTITPRYTNGNQNGANTALMGINYDESGSQQIIATASQIGSTWGITYKPDTRTIYAAAVLHRHAGFGRGADNIANTADDISSIYIFNNYAGTGAGTVSAVIDLNSFAGVNIGPNPRLGTTPANDLPASPFTPNHDYGVFGNEGKIGIGDIDLSSDGQTLYVVNMTQQQLVALNVTNPTAPTLIATYPIPNPGCPAGDNFRPWALGVESGAVYVGGICDAATTQVVTNLRAYVLQLTGATFTPVDLDTTSANTYLSLAYDRTRTIYNASFTNTDKQAEWQPWVDVLNDQAIQPLLSGIDFMDNGSMVLAFTDRVGLQIGNNNYGPNSADTTLYSHTSAGDLRKICNVGTLTVPAYVPDGTAGCPFVINPTVAGLANIANQVDVPDANETPLPHPGSPNRSFTTISVAERTSAARIGHAEIAVGAVAVKPGSDSLVITAMNPEDAVDTGTNNPPNVFNSAGFRWFNNMTGVTLRNNTLYNSTAPPGTTTGTFSKAVGLGDVDLLTPPAPIEIGNRVWRDTNNNGIQDAGELPIAGVVLGLYSSAGTLIDTVTTDSNGTYIFSSATGADVTGRNYGVAILSNTIYTVAVYNSNTNAGNPLAGLVPTTANSTGNTTNQDANSATPDVIDSDGVTVAVGTGGNAATIGQTFTTGPVGANNHSFDFGFSAPVSIGNQVWYDTNNNGLIDAGEVGVDSVRVELFFDANGNGTLDAGEQTPLAVQNTSNGGYYLFTQTTDNAGVGTGTALAPGQYFVGVAPSNFAAGGVLVGSRSSGTSISNAGVINEATFGTTDSDADNTDDGTTQTSGFYANGALSGVLVVTAGGEPTSEPTFGQAAGSTPGHFNTVDGTVGGNAIPDANSNLTDDFGFYRQTLGNLVFHDLANNGVYDAGTDTPLVGATVKLFAADGTTEIPVGPDGIFGTADDALGGVVTGAPGTYLFQSLPQGDYRVQVTPPTGFSSSTDIGSSANPNTNVDSDDNGVGAGPGAVMSAAVTLTPGSAGATNANVITPASGTTANPTVDFGFYTLSLGNLVWNDLDNNGLKDASETGIDSVTVNLYQDTDSSGTLTAGDTLVASQNTSNGGHYLFSGLAPATYLVQLDGSNFAAGGPLVGYLSSTGTNGRVTGPYEPVPSIGTIDNDDNGTTGNGGLATTGVTGGIASGPIPLAAGTQPTTETDLGMPTATTDLASNANSNLTIDFGVFQPASLGDYVWIDTNKDGVQDVGEIGVNGVLVSLYTPDGADGIAGNADDTVPIAKTVTATNGATQGYYHFANLTPNTNYMIALDNAADFAAGGPLAGYTLTGQDLGGNDTTDSDAALVGSVPTITNATTGGPGSDTPTYDFGFNTSASLGDYIWLDTNNDGVQDASESGINGVTVRLYDSIDFVLIDTQITAPNGGVDGYYHFANLDPNTAYDIKLDNPADFTGSGPLANTQLSPANTTTDTNDSDATLVTSVPTIASATTGGPGSDTPTYDIGFYRPVASLGDFVWNDINHNGIQDVGEPGINGVTVNLYDSTGTTLLDTITTVTNGGTQGYYHFDNLIPNTTYQVKLDNPPDFAPGGPLEDFILSPAIQGGNPATDSDATPVGGYPTITSAPTGADGSDTLTYDIGLYQPLSLGNQVWYDTNNNGVIDAGEVGVDGVRVELFLDTNANGTLDAGEQTPIAVQTTSSGGYYLFTQTTDNAGVGTGSGLVPGQYIVGIAPSNFAAGGVLAGSRSSGTSISTAGVISEAAIAANGATDSNADNADDGTTQTSGFYANGALSGVLALTAGGEPTSEPTFGQAAGSTPGHVNTVDGTAGGSAIPDANSNLTVDFGFYRQTLGNLVFNDASNNGVYNAGPDTPLVGATVKLYAQDGTTEIPVGPDGILGTADDAAGGIVTGAPGTYLFQNLPQGDYRVQVTPPTGFSSSTDIGSSANPNNNVDNDDNGVGAGTGAVMSAAVTLTPGDVGATNANLITLASGTTANPTVDFGFYTLSLGNLVWNDVNNNGLKDASETGIDGVSVNLYRDTDSSGTLTAGDTLVSNQATSNGGHYLFTGLASAIYIVQIDPTNFQAGGALVGYASSTGTNGAVSGPYEPGTNDATDNDDNGTTGSGGLATAGVTGGIASGPITLAAGTQPTTETDLGMPTGVTDPASNANSNLTIDFGVFQPASLGDYVWIDTDKDGVQDVGEVGVNGVQVSLYTANGKDGIAGNADDSLPVATTTTATNGATQGYYHFANLTPNTVYTIALDRASDFAAGGPLAGYTLTSQDAVGNDATDSDAALLAGVPTITIAPTGAPGSDTPTYDFGFNTSASLGDYIWLDGNNDGVQDGSETGINGVTVDLYDSTGTTLIATTTTTTQGGIDGYYHFANLQPNTTYVIKLDNAADFTGSGPLASTQLSPANTTTDTADSDATLVGSVPTIASATTGGPGTDTPTYDIGFYRPAASLGDYVWNDANKNGVQDVGETGINGVTVHLYDSTGTTLLATTTTATNGSTTGYYHFANLVPNTTYVVKLDNPTDYAAGGPLANLTLTLTDQGGNDATDSDATVVSGYPTIGTATTGGDGSDTPTYDIGFYQPLSLGNLVWNDLNNNGVKDASEIAIDGVMVNLYRDTNGNGTLDAGDTLVASQTTSNGGHYLFTGLAQATYLVELPATNFAAGGPLAGFVSSTGAVAAATGPYEPGATSPADNDDNGTANAGGIVSGPIVLSPGTAPTNEPDTTLPTGITDSALDANSNLTVDFGVFQPASLGNVVWNDVNNDGVKQPNEPGVPGVTVTLYDNTGTPITTTTTDVNGQYLFTDLVPGTYTIGFTTLPTGWTFTTPNAGGDDNTDSDVDAATGRTGPVPIQPGENNLTIYAGIVNTPTAITLTHFSATWQGATVVVAWTTGSEIDTFSFQLLRSTDGTQAHATRVTPTLIPAQGRGQSGAAYSWTDTTVTGGQSYTYWLEETEVDGTTHIYGPTTANASGASAIYRVLLPLVRR